MDHLIPTLVIAIFSYLFLGKYYQTLSKAIWNNAGVTRGDRHVTELILKVIQSKSLSIMRILVVASY